MHIEDIRPGMCGIGKTVFHGTKIEDFNVEIIDIISGDQSSGEYILAQLNGGQLKKVGGISAGMSGSPVYVEDKLIGAISHTWELSEHNLCLITPIERMLTLLEFPKGTIGLDDNQDYERAIHDVPNDTDSLRLKSETEILKNVSLGQNFKKTKMNDIFSPITTSLFINGLSGRAFDNLSNDLMKINLRAIQGMNGLYQSKLDNIGEDEAFKAEPGAAIGIQLTRGDVNIGSIGTVTYRMGDKLLALGHPFMRRGESAFFLSSVYIYHSLPNIVMPFKIGTPIKLIGQVSQDRDAGIVGVLNTYPRIVPLKIQVEDLDTGRHYQMGIQMIDDDFLLEPFISNFTIQAIDNTVDRIGEGSAMIEIDINGAIQEHKIFRKNMYCSKNDIATETIMEIPEISDLITGNYFEKIDLNEISIRISLTREIKCGRIEEIKLNKETFASGSTLEAKIKIRTFREGLIEKKMIMQIPYLTDESEAVLVIRGGGIIDQFSEENSNEYSEKNPSTLKEAIKDISERTSNNELVAEIILYNHENTWGDEIMGVDSMNEEAGHLNVSRIDTGMVIEGFMEIPFRITP